MSVTNAQDGSTVLPSSNPTSSRPAFSLRPLFFLAIVACVFLVILDPTTDWDGHVSPEARLRLEVARLDAACHRYAVELGEPPPEPNPVAFHTHVSTYYKDVSFDEILPSKRRLTDLDDDEQLVFWLRDVPSLLGRGIFCEFDEVRIVDSDGDGWLEYTSHSGLPFRVVEGEITAICPETSTTVGSRDYDK